jgi:hypothetical protein
MITQVPEGWEAYAAFVFGSFAALPDLGTDAGAAFRALALAKDVPFEPDSDRDYGDSLFPIGVTAYGLRRYGGAANVSSHVIYVGNHLSVVDLLEFWNIRATGREVWFVPVRHYRAHRTMVVALGGAGGYPINRQVRNRTDIQKAPSISDDQFREVTEWIRECGVVASTRSWRPRFGLEQEHYVGDIHVDELEGRSGEEVSFLTDARMTPVKLIAPPFLKEDAYVQDNHWTVGLDVGNPYENRDLMCRLPPAKGMDRLLHQMVFATDPGGPRLSKKGLAISATSARGTLYLHPLSTKDVLAELLKVATGHKVVASQPGRYADQIIRKMGSLQYDCRIFKIRGVREIIRQLSNGSTLTKGNMRDIVVSTKPDAYGQNWREDLYGDLVVKRGQRRPEFSAVFNEMLEKIRMWDVCHEGVVSRKRVCRGVHVPLLLREAAGPLRLFKGMAV